VLLTFGAQTIRTPTWHAFHLYVPHQDARRLPVHGDVPMLTKDDLPYPRVSVAASLAADDSTAVSLTHTDPEAPVDIELALPGLPAGRMSSARILAAATLDAHNTPGEPDKVASRAWTDFRLSGGKFTATLPPASLVTLQIAPAT
jgi:alpha-N-arabinofuranosidase